MRSISTFPAAALILISGILSASHAQAQVAGSGDQVAVGAQYDTTHVYVAPAEVDSFVKAFLGTFGGKSTPQVVVTVTPTPSKTSSQLLQTPVGTVSLFGFRTPVPVPFGYERTGYLITDMTSAVAKAKAAGADIIVTPFPDPIGVDAVVQWPGGINMQLYWHTKAPDYAAFTHVPENRIYVSGDRIEALQYAFIKFSGGKVISDDTVPGAEIAKQEPVRRIKIESTFGKMTIFATDGHLTYPYGAETTGYEVDDLAGTLAKAQSLGVTVIVPAASFGERKSAMVRFPGGYVAEIHQMTTAAK
jgi:predicted enzyme related to lactoylglutathione lyase